MSFSRARLEQVIAGGATTRFGYDGLNPVAELDASGNALRHHVFGPGPSTGSGQAYDQPLVTYEGAGFTDRRYLHADERGSIVALSDNSGARVGLNSYDEYGKPGAANSGRFQYTGQMWLPELGVHYYKARMYAQHLGRFYQPDPIGYWGGMNLYAYVRNDPVNLVDPLGLQVMCGGLPADVCGKRDPLPDCGSGVPMSDAFGGYGCGSLADIGDPFDLANVMTGIVVVGSLNRIRDVTDKIREPFRCPVSAVDENSADMLIETAGLFPAATTGLALFQLGVGAASGIRNAIQEDAVGAGADVVGYHLSSAEMLASQYRTRTARAVPIVGTVLSAVGLGEAAQSTYDDYRTCTGRP